MTLVLAMSDRFAKDYAIGDSQIQEYLSRITDDYERHITPESSMNAAQSDLQRHVRLGINRV